MRKLNIGKMECETCGNRVTVKQNELGTLSYRCDECDAAPYAKAGSKQHDIWAGKIESAGDVAKKGDAESKKNTSIWGDL